MGVREAPATEELKRKNETEGSKKNHLKKKTANWGDSAAADEKTAAAAQEMGRNASVRNLTEKKKN